MKIAVLGWGSLVWNRDKLPLAGDWLRGGPTLPIEFSRASKNGRITLVIDEGCGTRVPTRYAESADADVPAARESLRKREDTGSAGIASIDLLGDVRTSVRSRHICDVVTQWAMHNDIEAVVWTALLPNFMERLKKPYSWEAAFAHLDALNEAAKADAFRYIRNAPEEVQTPFRHEFEKRYPVDPA